MPKSLSEKIKELPQKPGVYLFKDETGGVIYVGKAVKLKNRVSSYFKKGGGDGSVRIQNMISRIRDFDYVVTDNEEESLILENNFIKQNRPKYNVMMRDDKNYLFLKINLQEEIPTIEYERKVTERKAKYFGPYTSGLSIKETLRMIRRIFPYCSANKVGDKPCFFYHIQKCPGVCIGKVSVEEYRKNTISKIIKFLEGSQEEVLKELQSQMRFLAKHNQFEKAGAVRDQIFALNRVMERQKLVYPNKTSQDVFSVHCEPTVAAVNLFRVREGKLIQKENFIIENTKQVQESEILQAFLPQYYLDATSRPKQLLLSAKIDENEIQNLLSAKIFYPTKGIKAGLIKLGRDNAKQYLEAQSDKHLLEEARLLSSLKELQRVLNLSRLPGRIEAFDISNIQGTNAVGSMIVFDFARAKKDAYRKFKIKRKQTPDDFAMMKEMLQRRFARSAFAGAEGAKQSQAKWPLPDLVLIDGGKGHLSTAVAVLKEYHLSIPIFGLAKRLEEIFLPNQPNPILLPPNSTALYLIQRIRDEAHRFAVTYHRKLRSKSSLSSALDEISGIGPAKKKKLLEKFRSVSGIRDASLTDISTIIGARLAEKLKATL